MAGKCKDMNKIKQLLRLCRDGYSNRRIASVLGINKETVNKYVKLARADCLSINELLNLEDLALEKRLQAGSPAYCDNRFDVLQNELDGILSNLSKKHITKQLLWEEYKLAHPDGYGYTQFCYHLNQHQVAASPSFVLSQERAGGEHLFVDYAGDTISYTNPKTGEEIKCQVFVACLPASDYGFAMAVPSQKIDDFLHALESCLRFLGGVPKIIVPDNLKSAVTKADRYQPELNTTFESFCNHFNCVSIPTRTGKPKDKALVENHVKIVYRRVYAPLRNETFFSLDELNKAILKKMKLHNQKRMQRHSFTREERYLSIDRPALRPLNPEPFEIKSTTQLQVLPNSYIYFGKDKVYYSVPYQYLRKKVKVVYTKTLVDIYCDGEKIAVHSRGFQEGSYYTIDNHFPEYHNDYKEVTPVKYKNKAAQISPIFEKVITQLFASNSDIPAESFYKSCDGLFHLQKKTEEELFERVCNIAIEFNNCKYLFIKNLIESKCAGVEVMEEEIIAPKQHENIRGKSTYQ